MNTALFLEPTNKIRRKKGQTVFTCHARSTLEAAVAEIINEIRSCDLSKWTGNKSLLIGPSQGWRQGGGLWFPWREDRASWKLQVSRETLLRQLGRTIKSKPTDHLAITEDSSMNKHEYTCHLAKKCIYGNNVNIFCALLFFVRLEGGDIAEK
jgi:hypothetical protein